MKFLKDSLIQPKSLVLIFAVTAVIVITYAFVEMHQSKKEMYELMQKQSQTLLESMLISSDNALLAYEEIEEELKERLLNNAIMIRIMYEKGMLNNALLRKIADDNDIYRINIFNNLGKKVLSSHMNIHTEPKEEYSMSYLKTVLEGKVDTLIIGLKPARFGNEQRYAVALSSKDGGAIVLNVDSAELINFRMKVGFGVLLRKLTDNPEIEYIALQDENGIIAAAGDVLELEAISSSQFLIDAYEDEIYHWRLNPLNGKEVFEAVQAFVHNNHFVGLFRVGISLEPIENINAHTTQRIIIFALVLFVFGVVTLTLIFIKQNFESLSKKFTSFESYSNRIIENVSDGILVLDSQNILKSINKAAQNILSKKEDELIGKEFTDIFVGDNCGRILEPNMKIEEYECTINGIKRVIQVSKSEFIDENKEINKIIVVRDLTERKELEKQVERSERLTAMGELASSVAHEIRNPLNTIGTITQQLGKDFLPKENENEFKSLTQLVYKEVRRINEIIENFLKFARPKPIKAENFITSEIFEQVKKQYEHLLNKKGIKLVVKENFIGRVYWDKTQIQQALMNLMENAIDSINNNGSISITVKETDEHRIVIIFEDNGKGISKEDLKKIFNLYFTTKDKGSGIGLSIVQKVISEHNGVIIVNSEVGKGTTFTIYLPKYFTGRKG